MIKKINNVFLFSITLLLSFLFFEILFHFSEISMPSYVVDDPRLGRDFKPNSHIMILNEGFFLGEVNQGGYLGPYYPKIKQENTIRIALCGDSFVEGFHLFYKHHFGKVLKDSLQNKNIKKVEVLNFGKAGLDIRTMYINYIEKVKDYNPDITIFFIRNSDFILNDNNLGPKLELKNDSLIVDYSFNSSKTVINKNRFSFLRNLASYSIFQAAYKLFRNGKTMEIILDKLSPSVIFSQDNNAENGAAPGVIDNYFDVNKAIIEAIKEENKISNRKTIFAHIDNISEPYKELIDENEIIHIDLWKALEKIRNQGINLNYWKATDKNGHWNSVGHAEIGSQLSKDLSVILK